MVRSSALVIRGGHDGRSVSGRRKFDDAVLVVGGGRRAKRSDRRGRERQRTGAEGAKRSL
ncbi:hypothetical protein PJI17_25355 [Mycobacterium kansasii]